MAPQGTTAGPPLSHPEQPVQTAQHRALPGSGACRRGCRGALDAWEEPRRGGATGRGGATFVAPATAVAPVCWPGLTRPTPHRGTLPVTFCRRGAAPFYHAHALQALAIQGRRGNPSDWHQFCLSVHRGRGVTHTASGTHRWREAITGGNRHTGIAVKAPRLFASNFPGAASGGFYDEDPTIR